LGSMVQNGKLADCALAFDRQLNRVDLPTLGRPTIPHCNDIVLYLVFIVFSSLIDAAKLHFSFHTTKKWGITFQEGGSPRYLLMGMPGHAKSGRQLNTFLQFEQ